MKLFYKKMLPIFLVTIGLQTVTYIVSATFINWGPQDELSGSEIFSRLIVKIWGFIFPFFIAGYVIRKRIIAETLSYLKRAWIVTLLILIKNFTIIILNTINPAERIITKEEWIGKSLLILFLSIFEIFLGFLLVIFLKARKSKHSVPESIEQ